MLSGILRSIRTFGCINCQRTTAFKSILRNFLCSGRNINSLQIFAVKKGLGFNIFYIFSEIQNPYFFISIKCFSSHSGNISYIFRYFDRFFFLCTAYDSVPGVFFINPLIFSPLQISHSIFTAQIFRFIYICIIKRIAILTMR